MKEYKKDGKIKKKCGHIYITFDIIFFYICNCDVYSLHALPPALAYAKAYA
jgi:hypothetical protein